MSDFERELRKLYEQVRPGIEERFENFTSVWERGDDRELLCELFFCLLTPAARARSAWQALNSLREKGLILCEEPNSDERENRFQRIAGELTLVRFKNNKARNILEAERRFTIDGSSSIRSRLIRFASAFEMRDWLAGTVRGMGYKEASHFLRNIGQGGDIAILDRHILRNLIRFGILEKMPDSLTRKRYLQIEELMRSLARKTGIPLHHLDLVLWYRETGEIFK